MILITCVDNNMGMMFNNRRQSQDKALRKYILELTSNSHLWMNNYSARQFESESAPQIIISNTFLNEAVAGEYCFLEDEEVTPYEERIEKIILFKWNRDYPSDRRFSINISNWKLTQSLDFPGSSHDNITMEVYVK